MPTILMVAEKPSLAQSISHLLSHGTACSRPAALPVYEYNGNFYGQSALFRVTSTTGHVFSCDFTPQHQNWDKTEEEDLFGAPVKKDFDSKVYHHLQKEANGCSVLVLWLDCDREGENICFEVMNIVKKQIYKGENIWRARFSAITFEELNHAMNNLVKPNKALSDAVECRQELDLKVGVAFTRFQTKYFQGKYGDLDARVVSYGPCQTPTLGFCVQRHDEIINFKPEDFWRIVPTLNRGDTKLIFDWERGRLFDEPMAKLMYKQVTESKTSRVTAVHKTKEVQPRPTGLNTVELLKIASSYLGIGPHQAMSIAESLYISGYVSYPRTESSAYPPSFDLRGALSHLQGNSTYAPFIQRLLFTGAITSPKAGHDAGDHPPITPMRAASPGDLSGDSWRVYDYITRHFIASLSPDAMFDRTKIVIDLNGEVFSLTGKSMRDPGWMEIMSAQVKEDKLPDVATGDQLQISEITLRGGQTQPPSYLTESDLIGLMEKNGIGTDASIPTHINNICERNYCTVQAGRVMVPTKLGIILVHGIQTIDPELTLPMVRGQVEEYVTEIANEKAPMQDVLYYALNLFFNKFSFFKSNIDKMDALFSASFSSLSQTGKYITRCGHCQHYMRHIDTRPQRLYCQTCEVTYNLPQGGAIKQYSSFTCPYDNFELLISHIDGGKSLPICPYCYNNPPFEELVDGTYLKVMSCNECLHPTCMHSLATNYVSDCIDDQCKGSMVFEPGSTGKWRLSCNNCNMILKLPPTAQRVRVASVGECIECGSRKMTLEFPAGKSVMPNKAEKVCMCVYCDAQLSSLCEVMRGRTGNFGRGGGRGAGRERGRGGGSGGRKKRYN